MGMVLVDSIGDTVYEFQRDDNRKLVVKKSIKKSYFYYLDAKGKYKSLTGETCSRCICNKTSDMRNMRESFIKTFEADVSLTNRYLIDEFFDKEIPKTDIRTWYLDIEVDDSKGYQNINNHLSRITAITIYDNYQERYYTLLLNRDINILTQQHAVKSFKDDETEMLKFFIKLLDYLDPDLITAWNIMFDMPYIFKRLQFNGINPDALSRLNKVYLTPDNIVVKGRLIIDLLSAYKKLTFGQLSSYALEFVSQQELGEGKIKYKGVIEDMNDDDFLSYNKRDVELLLLLDRKMHILEFFDSIRRLARCNMDDVFSNKRVVDSFILVKAKQKNIILPTANPNATKVDFEGAYVKEPPRGLHRWVASFDIRSLYPSIIMQFNMSYETIISKEFVNQYPQERIINLNDRYFFIKDIKGFAPELMEELMEARQIYKDKKKAATNPIEERTYHLIEQSIKVIMNSYYGVTSTPHFRLFRPEIGAAITEAGRNIIQAIEKDIEDRNYKVDVVDTDSVYIETQQTNLDDAIEKSKEIYQNINNIWEPLLTKYNAQPNRKMLMQHEKVYSTLLTIGVKKRYAGIVLWKDGKLLSEPKFDVKGFQIIRSDFPLRAQKFLKEIFINILNDKSKQDCLDCIKKFKEDFKLASVEDIGFPTSIKAVDDYQNYPMHVRAAENSQKYLNIPYINGSKIRYYFVKKTPVNIPYDNVWVFKDDIPAGFEIDWKRSFERIIDGPLEPIFESIGWQNQTTLDKFFTTQQNTDNPNIDQ